MSLKKLLLLALIAAVIGLWFVFDLGQYATLGYFNQHKAELFAAKDAMPLLYGGIYFAIYVIAAAFALPAAALLTLAGGAIFGLWYGLALVSFASTLGATFAFLISRTLLRDWVQRRYGDALTTLNEGVAKDGAFYLFTLRMVPVFPFVAINLLMALTPIRVLTFAVVSQIGMIPGTIAYVFAGTQLATLETPGDLLSPGLIGAFVLLGVLPLVMRKIINSINKRRALKGFRRPKHFDDNVIVIGAGSGGLVAALTATIARAKVTLIEKDKMGGDCLNTGCVPSKTIIQSAKVAHRMRHSEKYGIKNPGKVEVDFPAVMERVQAAIRTIAPKDSTERYSELGVNCIIGAARLVDPWTVEVDGQKRTARSIILATGGNPIIPPIPGIDQADPLTSDSVWAIREQPKRLLVVGGGPIGCELAQAFARLGSEVTILQGHGHLVPREDPDVSTIIEERFRSEGINVVLNTMTTSFKDAHTLIAKNKESDEESEFTFDRVLVATGRRANTEGLGLEALNLDRGPNNSLLVNQHLQTSMQHIYACGDVSGPYQFTHMASYQAGYAALNALFGWLHKFRVNYRVTPWCTYTEPEIARVGLNETEAIAKQIEHEVTCYDLDDSDRAIADGDTTGFIKVITPRQSDKILGVTIIGAQAGELLPEFVLAFTHGLGLKKIMDTIHVYPTLSEANKAAAAQWRKANAPEKLLDKLSHLHAFMR